MNDVIKYTFNEDNINYVTLSGIGCPDGPSPGAEKRPLYTCIYFGTQMLETRQRDIYAIHTYTHMWHLLTL